MLHKHLIKDLPTHGEHTFLPSDNKDRLMVHDEDCSHRLTFPLIDWVERLFLDLPQLGIDSCLLVALNRGSVVTEDTIPVDCTLTL